MHFTKDYLVNVGLSDYSTDGLMLMVRKLLDDWFEMNCALNSIPTNKARVCPKCGGNNIGLRYIPPDHRYSVDAYEYIIADVELMHHTCRVCDYKWVTKCDDYKE